MQDKYFTVRFENEEFYRNITDKVQEVVVNWNLKDGHIHVFVEHTTCAIFLQEDEPCLMKDLLLRLGWIAPTSQKKVGERYPDAHSYYRHDDFSVRTKNLGHKERINGHAHVRASFLDRPWMLRVRNGKIHLGRWQQLLFFDFDDLEERRERKIVVSIIQAPVFQ